MNIPNEPSECAFTKDNLIGNDKTCFTSEFIEKVNPIVNTTKKNEVIPNLLTKFGCKNESCLLKQNAIRNLVGDAEILKQLMNFRPPGPHTGESWFSNTDIDSVLQQIEKAFEHKKFKHVFYQMDDFIKNNTSLATINWVDEYTNGTRCFGVVFNTDNSSGGGQHWYAIFGDFSNLEQFTIEYFDSSGSEPHAHIKNWMFDICNELKKELSVPCEVIIASKQRHQNDRHSCGSYSLYYIISRLNDKPYTYFMENIIPDIKMHEFRYSLFRKDF